jgi:hypothetical protein
LDINNNIKIIIYLTEDTTFNSFGFLHLLGRIDESIDVMLQFEFIVKPRLTSKQSAVYKIPLTIFYSFINNGLVYFGALI